MLTTSRIRSLCDPQMVDATSPATPWLFWKDAVLLAAHRAVEGLAKDELDRFLPTSEWRDRLRLWYNCGEPVWMAAKSLADVATECAKHLVPGAGDESLEICRMFASIEDAHNSGCMRVARFLGKDEP